MNRKRLIFLAFACLVVAVLLCSQIPIRSKSRINDDTISLIHVGMTRQEVESIFGVPPREYLSHDAAYLCLTPPYRRWNYKNDPVIWGSYEAQARIHFDDAGVVEGVYSDCRIEINQTFLARIRGWFGL